MNIAHYGLEIKPFLDRWVYEWGAVCIVFLVALASFGLGRLSASEDVSAPVSVDSEPLAASPSELVMGGLVVGSREGKTYYYPWCSGASKIAPRDQVWFQTEREAEAAGYAPSKSCKGLGSE